MKRMQAAEAQLAGTVMLEKHWRAFQLDPRIPRDGVDHREYLTAKFGSSAQYDAATERVREEGAKEGIAFRFDLIAKSPNTQNAHRLIRWAAQDGLAQQAALVARLFSDYFERGRDIGSIDVLVLAASSVGMDADLVRDLLDSERDVDLIREEVAGASRAGINSVPCFVIEKRYAIMGAQPADGLARAFGDIAGAKQTGNLPAA
jgi:predicted DsbA family dithiol-disulfide isomerase